MLPRVSWQRLAAACTLAAIYVAAGRLGLHLAVVNPSATAVWPPTGLAIGGLLLLGPSAWPAVFVGAFVVNWTTQGTVFTSAGIAAGNTLEAVLGAWLTRSLAGGDAAFDSPRRVARFAGFACLGATAVSAVVGVTTLLLGHLTTTAAAPRVLLNWWLGDAVGAVMIVPLVLLWTRAPERSFTRRDLAEAGAILAALVGVAWLVFGGGIAFTPTSAPLGFLCLPLLTWSGLRCQQRLTATFAMVLSVVALAGTLLGHGPFALAGPEASLLLVQAFVGLLTLTALALGAAALERRRAEESLRTAQEEAMLSTKMEAVGRLAAAVSHDFNNVLTVIIGYAQLLLSDMEHGDPRRSGVECIHDAAERAATLTRQLLAFAGENAVSRGPVDLNAVIRDVDQILQRLLGEGVSLTLDLDPGLLVFNGDPRHLELVLLNLALNARDAMAGSGELTVATANEERALPDGGDPVPHVRLTVTDEGVGMTSHVRRRLFEPFFTTKPHGSGTGLGLSTVYAIVRHGGGQVHVSSAPGRGTRFDIWFPASHVLTRDLAPHGSDAIPASEVGERATILVVEDEAPVRGFLADVLRRSGHQVIEAQDGLEALRLVQGLGQRPDVLVADLRLPRLRGDELARRLRAELPNLGVLFVTGHVGITPVDARTGEAALLTKPVQPADLVRRVRDVLARARSRADGRAEATDGLG